MPEPNGTDPADAVRIGIDLGGTKIAGIALGADDATLDEVRVPSPRGDYRATLAAIAAVVGDLEGRAGSQGSVGVGVPGAISPVTGRMQNANSVWLNGQPLAEDLSTALGRPVRIANDANCFALSETRDGAARGARSVFGVIIGTGCGGGIVLDGRLLDGPNGVGGEWGHNPLPWASASEHPGPACWCGRRGCIETWVSGPGLAADHTAVTGRQLTAEEIAAAAGAGERAAQATLARHADRLARSLAHVVNMIDPEVITLGGGLSQMKTLYAALPALMARHIFADRPVVDLRPPRWGDASGVRGAARLWDVPPAP
jgi:fructokinase